VRHPEVARGAYDTRFIERHLSELVGPGAVDPRAGRSLAAAAAVAAARSDERLAPDAQTDGNAVSPWVLAERTARFER
jgi:hypothetical protein